MTREPNQNNSPTDLPAPQPCRQSVQPRRARKALIAALSGAGAATVLAASLTGQPTLQAQPVPGGIKAGRVIPAASEPASQPVLQPVALGGKPGVAKLTTQPTQPAVELIEMPLGGVQAPAKLAPATAPAATQPALQNQNVKGGMGAVYRIDSTKA